MFTEDPPDVEGFASLMHQYRRCLSTAEVHAMQVQAMTDEELHEFIRQRVFTKGQMDEVRDAIEEEINIASEDYYGRRGYPRPARNQKT